MFIGLHHNLVTTFLLLSIIQSNTTFRHQGFFGQLFHAVFDAVPIQNIRWKKSLGQYIQMSQVVVC